MKHLVSLLLLFCLLILLCGGEGKDSKTVKKVAKALAKGAIASKKASSRFFTAWTIISIGMLIIIISVIAYYLHMFYPLVCAKRGKYDVMEMGHA